MFRGSVRRVVRLPVVAARRTFPEPSILADTVPLRDQNEFDPPRRVSRRAPLPLGNTLVLCLSPALYGLMNSPAPSTKFFTCPHCPTEYWVSYKASLTRDSGSAYCKVCRKKMIEWNDYSQPSFSPVLESLNDDRPLPSSLRSRPHR